MIFRMMEYEGVGFGEHIAGSVSVHKVSNSEILRSRQMIQCHFAELALAWFIAWLALPDSQP